MIARPNACPAKMGTGFAKKNMRKQRAALASQREPWRWTSSHDQTATYPRPIFCYNSHLQRGRYEYEYEYLFANGNWRAKTPVFTVIFYKVLELPCRIKKSAWHLHGAYS